MNKKHSILFLFLLTLISFFIISCKKDPTVKTEPVNENISLVIPAGWPAPHYDFSTNTLSNDGFALGRKLFYDKKLSANNTISCASCHNQSFAFSDEGHSLSNGINGLVGTRNAPSLSNLIWQNNFMYDGGINHIEVQPLAPINNPLEMGETISNVINKLQSDSEYPALFKKAFGTETISTQLICKAFAQYLGMLVSSNSKYDLYIRGDATFTSSESSGYNLFQLKCASCHPAPLFTNLEYINFGLDSIITDAGRGGITGIAADSGTFKVPSLRNVAISSPYMHDGRFNTLEQVLEHYSTGIKHSTTLSPLLTNIAPLTLQEKQDLISFLNTLTDNTYINDSRFKNSN